MYAWLWRHLPGSPAVRGLQLVGLVIAVLVVCVQWAFPVLADLIAPAP